jgi:hypothetical protein
MVLCISQPWDHLRALWLPKLHRNRPFTGTDREWLASERWGIPSILCRGIDSSRRDDEIDPTVRATPFYGALYIELWLVKLLEWWSLLAMMVLAVNQYASVTSCRLERGRINRKLLAI